MTDPIHILFCVFFSTLSKSWAGCPGLCAQCEVGIIATGKWGKERGLDAMMAGGLCMALCQVLSWPLVHLYQSLPVPGLLYLATHVDYENDLHCIKK